MTAMQATVRWLIDVNAVLHMVEVLGDLVPEPECDALLDRLEQMGEWPSAATWGVLAGTMRSLHQATEAVGHPLAPLLRHWTDDLTRQRDRAAQPPGSPGHGGGAWHC